MSASIHPSPSPAPNLYGMSRSALADHLVGSGLPRYRADQIYSWVYQKRLRTSDRMVNLPGTLRSGLGSLCAMELPTVVKALATPDGGTRKFVLGLEDGER